MSIYKRGKNYWYEFLWQGQRFRCSTHQRNAKAAQQMEDEHRTRLAKGQRGLIERQIAPTLKDFRERFLAKIRVDCRGKCGTIEFYTFKMNALLRYAPLATRRLDAIDEALIDDFKEDMARQEAKPATVNRCLATLRRALRIAQERKIIDRVPKFRMLQGEHVRDFVLSRIAETTYLEVCPESLRSLAELTLETGTRITETLTLLWADVHLEPIGDASRGYIRIRSGKTPNAKRNISLSERARNVLLRLQEQSKSEYVFPAPDGLKPLSRFTLEHQHKRVRELLKMSSDFVIHSFRHTFCTRLGEAGVDAFSIMRIAGHSSVVVSQRYVHPSSETMELAIDKLETAATKVSEKLDVPTKVPTATVQVVEMVH